MSLALTYWKDLASLAIVLLATLVVITALRKHLAPNLFRDRANHRSLHSGVTPKIGGLAVFPAVLLTLLGRYIFEPKLTMEIGGIAVWLGCSLLVFCVCVVNDRSERELHPSLRMGFFIVAAVLFHALLPLATERSLTLRLSPPLAWFAYFFMISSTLAFINFYNFMDGMDGLAGSMGVIGFTTLGTLAWNSIDQTVGGHVLALACLAVAFASSGFLILNWPPARIFLGDTGSTFLGFSALALGWLGTMYGIWDWSLPFIVFFPFWFDAGFTLTRRALQRKPVWRAHREHFYQRAVLAVPRTSLPDRHRAVLFPALALMILSSMVALAQHAGWWVLSDHQPWPSFLVLFVVHSMAAQKIRRTEFNDANASG